MALGPLQYDSTRAQDMTESDYYKKLQKGIREKREKTESDQKSEFHASKQSAEEAVAEERETQKTADLQYNKLHASAESSPFEDEIELSQESQEAFDEMYRINEEDEEKSELLQEFEDELRHDGSKILQFFSQKVVLGKKIPEFKQMYKEVVTQSRSDNPLLAKFAKFKVGVVGQILSMLNLKPDEIKQLKRDAMTAAFNENLELMEDNVYNSELAEMVHGKNSRRTQSSMELFETMRNSLVTKMNNLGRPGYWSTTRLLEEKICQCEKIAQEFDKEIHSLKYQHTYYLQQQGVYHEHTT